MTLSDSASYWLPKKENGVIYPPGKVYLRKKFKMPKDASVENALI